MSEFFTLGYHHRHGDDVTLYRFHRDALISACNIIIEWIEEISDAEDRYEILSLIDDDELVAALELWTECQGNFSSPDELLIITPIDVQALEDINGPDLQAVLALAKEELSL